MEEREILPEDPIEEQAQPNLLEKLKFRRLHVLAGILVVLTMAGAAFAGYKLGLLKRRQVPALEIGCQENADCVLAISRKETCCQCPVAINKSQLEKDKDLMIYLPGEMGRSQRVLPECKNIACSPCPWWERAACEDGKCRGVSGEGSEPEVTDWKTYINTKDGYSIKYPPDWQSAESDQMVEFQSGTSPGLITISVKENPSGLSLREWLTQKEENENWKQEAQEVWVGNVQGIRWGRVAMNITTGEKYDQVDVFLPKNSLVYQLRYFSSQGAPSQLEIFNQMPSTLRFLDSVSTGQDSAEGKFCGGIAGILCPSGYSCQLEGDYPDAGGRCVRE